MNFSLRPGRWLALCMLALCSQTALAQANTWPARLVTLVIPFPSGGSTEVEFRYYTQKLSDNLGKPVVLDYKPGAGSMVGTAFVAKAPPDGHTLLGTTSSYAVLPSTYPDLPYDPLKDLAPVSQMTSKSSIIVVQAGLPVKSIPELIAYAKSNPGKLNHATSGSGGGPHLRAAWLYKLAGVEPTFVHYKGTGQMTLDLVAQRVDVVITLPVLAMPYIKSGKLRAIAGTGSERNRLLPDVPTVSEQGFPNFEYSNWAGVFAPGATPAALVNRINQELAKVAKAPDIAQKLAEEGNIMVTATPAHFRQIIVADIDIVRRMVKETGIKLEQ
jgi:tripartite-type tricarboxylate transporter receptor subunit TctC